MCKDFRELERKGLLRAGGSSATATHLRYSPVPRHPDGSRNRDKIDRIGKAIEYLGNRRLHGPKPKGKGKRRMLDIRTLSGGYR